MSRKKCITDGCKGLQLPDYSNQPKENEGICLMCIARKVPPPNWIKPRILS